MVWYPKAKRSHIFGRFFRAHTGTLYDHGGMGVGLYINEEIVAQHGGRIEFEGVEDQGVSCSSYH
jgi:signal transduction histidine kinase